MKCFAILFFILFSAFSNALLAQDLLGLPLVYNYSKSIYQGGSRTWDIKQDSHGIMYFGNSEGLLTFDGRYWKTFSLPNHTNIRSIWIDADDRIYVGGQGDFGYFERSPQSGLVYRSLQDLVPEKYWNFADIWNTVGVGQSVFFRGTNVIFELKGQKIQVHPAAVEWYYMGQSGGMLYAQDKKNGLLEFRDNKWTPYLKDLPFKNVKIASLMPFGKNRMLLSTLNNETYALLNMKLTRLNAQDGDGSYTPSLAKIDDSTFVVGNAKEGCHIRNLAGNTIQRIGVREGLQNKNVTAVFVDRQKNIWIGTDNVISVISYGSAIRYLRPNMENDVTGYSALIFNHTLYLSSSNGVYYAGIKNGLLDQSRSPSVFSLLQGSDGGEAWRLEQLNGQLLLGHNKGLFQILGHSIRPLSRGIGTWKLLPLNMVYPIEETLVGTYQGLELLHFHNGVFSSRGPLNGPSDSFRFLEQDEHGTIWASHPYRGIYRITLSQDRKSYQAQLYTQKQGLPADYQNYVFKIKNQVVFATEKGLYNYDYARKRFVPSKQFAAFKDLTIRYLRDDQDGNVWFCTKKTVGLGQFDSKKETYHLINFPEIEGMNTSGFEHIYSFDRNNIYVGAEKGALHINYDKYLKQSVKPVVILSRIVATGKGDSLIFGGFFSNASKRGQASAKDSVLQLPAVFNSFRFSFSSPSYGIHQHLEFSYKLSGYDENWSSWTQQSEKSYTNLQNGQYTFLVKVRNNLNQESNVEEYSFVVLPPWYKTVWAKAFYFLLCMLGVLGLIRFRKIEQRKQQRKYEQQLAQLRYIHQLEIEKNEKEIVKLNNEKLAHEVMAKTKELASTSMQLLENSGALIKVRDELSKLDTGEDEDSNLRRINNLLKDIEKNSANWNQFASHFDELNDGFLNKLKEKHPGLSRNDLKVCAYLKLHFTSKQIAQLQNITVRGVEIHRYRLRKKLQVETELSLNDYLNAI
ncbi:two-component regulator propeller domain-containing protein [Sphingobacterium sp. DR205]|uniref:two-component regulator propeller domain-containing protein n=1 Tax=Sphingobacterium sp. DR205 TaxID=2713573 RepID=UPI0013E504E7|nr:two-component regulator propeller domain-containing protein [Sphingobacterium sp. DR205]QIH33708.1 transcriptional regulator [Sphingobacterium sp. DR205]